MDVYILDDLYRQVDVVDKYLSLVWTERFQAWGDFEMHLHSVRENRIRMMIGTRLLIEQSYRVMIIETVEDTVDQEGREILKVRGRSLETILENRLARDSMDDLTTEPKWVWNDPPYLIANSMFNHICITGALDPGDIIPDVGVASEIFPEDTIPFSTDPVLYEIDMMSLYQAIRDLCNIYGMGFRMVRDLTGQLWFDTYMGSDRTTQQTTLPAVVFSPSMDNLTNVTEFSSNVLYKNVAYVVSAVGSEIVYALDVDPAIEGFERRVLFIKAEDITDPTPATASAQMIQRGLDELSRNRKIVAFDGELNQNSKYKYGTDYNLGDLVEFQNDTGARSIMRATEQIFTSDKEGDRSYPTLEIYATITPGAWDTLPPDLVWDDIDPGIVWDDFE